MVGGASRGRAAGKGRRRSLVKGRKNRELAGMPVEESKKSGLTNLADGARKGAGVWQGVY